MALVNIDILINADPNTVFNFISNFENNPKWQKGMVSATITSGGELRIGTTYDQIARFMRKDIVTSFKVIEYIPNSLIKAESTSGSFPITFTRIVENEDGKARVKAVIEGDASGFFKLFNPLMSFFVRRNINADYKRLKTLFEK
ncbi:MAG: SRPBCC family protein [Candidatus Kariarchaeaceae archaeon]|jgi:hypothetical protein